MLTDREQIKQALNLTDDEIDSHETDLYIKHTPEREKKIIELYPFYAPIGSFYSNIDHAKWIELPFFLIDDKIKRCNKIRTGLKAIKN